MLTFVPVVSKSKNTNAASIRLNVTLPDDGGDNNEEHEEDEGEVGGEDDETERSGSEDECGTLARSSEEKSHEGPVPRASMDSSYLSKKGTGRGIGAQAVSSKESR